MADDAAPPSPTLRICYGVVQTVTILVFASLCFVSRNFERIFRELDMRMLPAPTMLVTGLAPFFRGPAGLALLAALAVALVVLGLRGAFDRSLRKLIVANVLGTLGIVAFTVMSLYLPIWHIQDVLDKK